MAKTFVLPLVNLIPHFLDLELRDDGIAFYTKPTNSGLYVDYNSNVPWAFRVSRIKSITTRVKNICSAVYLKSELESIKRYASWNNFPNIWDQQYYEKSYK